MTDDRLRTARTGGSGRGRAALLGRSGAPRLLGAALVLVLTVAALVAGMWVAGRTGASADADETGPTISQVADSDRSVSDPDHADTDAGSTQVPTPDPQVRAAAREDAEALTAAEEAVDAAAVDLDATAAILRAHHDQVSGPVLDLVTTHPEAFSAEVIDVFSIVVDGAAAQLEDPLGQNSHGEHDADQQTGATAAPTTLPHLSPTVTDRVATLEEHYEGRGDDELEAARTEVAREVDRLAEVAEEHAGATLRLRGRLESLDQALVGVLLAAEGVGSTTAQALSHSSEEASDDFAAAVAELSRLSGVQVDEASWRARSVEQPTVVVGVLEAVETYLVNERAARASHELHQPVPEESSDPAPVPSEDEGSGQGARACLKWGLYGTYIGWCY